MDFYKLHLNGHDFILVNAFRQPLAEQGRLALLAKRICLRSRGVGGRGLVLLFPGEEHQCRAEYFNREGERDYIPADALMCTSRYAFDFGLADRGTTVIENEGKPLSVQCIDGVHFRFSLEQPATREGKAISRADDVDLSVSLTVGSRSLSCTPLRFRRTVLSFYDRSPRFNEKSILSALTEEIDIEEQYYPVGYRVFARDEIEIFFPSSEEGDAVEGAAGAATSAVLGGFCDRDVVVHYGGGKFLYEWEENRGRVFITAGPVYVFSGNYELDTEEE